MYVGFRHRQLPVTHAQFLDDDKEPPSAHDYGYLVMVYSWYTDAREHGG